MTEKRSSRRRLSFREQSEESIKQCELCHHPHIDLSSPGKWNCQAAREFVANLGVGLSSLVCAPCRKHVTKCMSDENHRPRWVQKEKVLCCISNCSDSVFSTLSKPQKALVDALQQAMLSTSSAPPPVPTPLCRKHYNDVYHIIHQRQTNCITCKASLRYTEHRLCPNPSEITKFLRQNTDFEGNIQEKDCVCFLCYTKLTSQFYTKVHVQQ